MYAAPGAGALIGAAASGWVGAVRRQGLAVIVSVVAWGAAIVAFGLVPHDRFPLALILLAAAGWADVISAVFRNTILQLVAPDEMRGRLSALHIAVVTSGPRLGDARQGRLPPRRRCGSRWSRAGWRASRESASSTRSARCWPATAATTPEGRYLRRLRPPPRAYPAGANPATYLARRPGSSPWSSASSIMRTASLTTRPPRYRTGSGGNARPGSRTRPALDHSSLRPNASDARIRPPTQLGPTPFPDSRRRGRRCRRDARRSEGRRRCGRPAPPRCG